MVTSSWLAIVAKHPADEGLGLNLLVTHAHTHTHTHTGTPTHLARVRTLNLAAVYRQIVAEMPNLM
jgi:hypothetical protein